MQNCLSELNLNYYLIHLNDIIVFSQTVEEHLQCLHIIFHQFKEHNLKLKQSKCDFFPKQNNLPSSLSLEGGNLPQQLKSEGYSRMRSATDIHRGMHLSWPGRPSQEIHEGLCVHCPAP